MRTLSVRLTRVWFLVPCLIACMAAAAVVAWAQTRKAGLWETTTLMSWQKSPMPNGAPPPGAMGGSHTSQVCLTQAMIDKYGAPMPLNRADCSVTNIEKTDHGMTAEMVCTGRMNGKATMESSWQDPEHAKGKVHFTGNVEAGQTPRPVEWTANSSSVFKSADCGTVKPVEPNSR
jgi:hypothetical protein